MWSTPEIAFLDDHLVVNFGVVAGARIFYK